MHYSIRDITVPILVLHAKDDGMVSYRMGHKVSRNLITTKQLH